MDTFPPGPASLLKRFCSRPTSWLVSLEPTRRVPVLLPLPIRPQAGPACTAPVGLHAPPSCLC